MINQVDKLAIISLYSRGHSLRSIAKTLGHSRQTVTTYVNEYKKTMELVATQGETEELKARLYGAPKRKSAPRACSIYVGSLKERFVELASNKDKQVGNVTDWQQHIADYVAGQCTDEEKRHFIARGWLEAESAQQEVVNLHVFQTYLQHYLTTHPMTHKELMMMVRQMQPTSEGVPLEIYCFSNTSEWPKYEQIQAEIFDHIFAIIPEFGLRIFQSPSGIDIKSLQGKASN